MSDKLRTSRVKVYCPRCEESYLPKYKNMNLDGSFFGTSLPHIFLKHFPLAIILPPKVYFYEPKIFGFRLFGKKGSKYNRPVKGNARFTEEEENLAQLTNQFKLNYSKQKEEFKSS
jgi:casein kinase II subunit beta